MQLLRISSATIFHATFLESIFSQRTAGLFDPFIYRAIAQSSVLHIRTLESRPWLADQVRLNSPARRTGPEGSPAMQQNLRQKGGRTETLGGAFLVPRICGSRTISTGKRTKYRNGVGFSFSASPTLWLSGYVSGIPELFPGFPEESS